MELNIKEIRRHSRIMLQREVGKRNKKADTSCLLRLRAHYNCQKLTPNGVEPLQNPTNRDPRTLRENGYFKWFFGRNP